MAAAPLMPMMIGAGIGAATSDDPLKGALLGGALGGVGGSMFSGMDGAASASANGALNAGSNMAANAVAGGMTGGLPAGMTGNAIMSGAGLNSLGAGSGVLSSAANAMPATASLAGWGSSAALPNVAANAAMNPGMFDVAQNTALSLTSGLRNASPESLMKAGDFVGGMDKEQPPVVQSPMIAPPPIQRRQPQSFAQTFPMQPGIGPNPYQAMFTSNMIRPR